MQHFFKVLISTHFDLKYALPTCAWIWFIHLVLDLNASCVNTIWGNWLLACLGGVSLYTQTYVALRDCQACCPCGQCWQAKSFTCVGYARSDLGLPIGLLLSSRAAVLSGPPCLPALPARSAEASGNVSPLYLAPLVSQSISMVVFTLWTLHCQIKQARMFMAENIRTLACGFLSGDLSKSWNPGLHMYEADLLQKYCSLLPEEQMLVYLSPSCSHSCH